MDTMTDISEYLLECDVYFYKKYALPTIQNNPERFDLEGFESVMKSERPGQTLEDGYREFRRDTSAQYELNPKYGRYVWDLADQWYQKWCVVFSIEHMCNWVKDGKRPEMFDAMGWLGQIAERYHVHCDHLELLKDMCRYIADWHQSNRQLTLKGIFKLNTMPFFPPTWFINKSRQGNNEGLAPSYLATFRPPFCLDSQVPERWDQFNLDPILINTTIPILGLTVHRDPTSDSSQLMFVMPKAKYGNLEHRLQNTTPKDYLMPCELALNITKDIKNLHWNFIHGNIHPRNILFSHADYVGELVDITFMKRSDDKTLCCAGRWPYVSAEVVSTGQSTSADIYALGIILWQLISRVTFPADRLVDPHTYRIEPIPDVLEEYQLIYLDCMNPNHQKRPNAYSLYKRLSSLCARLKTYNVPLSDTTLGYINSRRTECDIYLTTQVQPNTLSQVVGDQVLTASVTRNCNQQLSQYPSLFV
ncbi:hypothetical protein G6F56_006378 [Rhizopus delemar]|nr:hypothetical protein G6F56_006378 [Rhizopus delemar]